MFAVMREQTRPPSDYYVNPDRSLPDGGGPSLHSLALGANHPIVSGQQPTPSFPPVGSRGGGCGEGVGQKGPASVFRKNFFADWLEVLNSDPDRNVRRFGSRQVPSGPRRWRPL